MRAAGQPKPYHNYILYERFFRIVYVRLKFYFRLVFCAAAGFGTTTGLLLYRL